MISISVKTNVREAIAGLSKVQRQQVPFAASVAINKTAGNVQDAIAKQAGQQLNAKPFTTGAGALYVQRSNKRALTAEVGYKTIQARYMQWQVSGGQRTEKGLERKLSAMGLLPDGYVTTPGAAMRLDAYGNIPRRAIVELLGQLRAQVRVYAGRGKRQSLRGLFVVLPGSQDKRVRHLQPGIWLRLDDLNGQTVLQPLIAYVSRAEYRKRLDLPRIAQGAVDAHFDAHFAAALSSALADAR